MKKCQHCGNPFEPKLQARNQKFCSVTCRHKKEYIARGGAEAQRKYLDRIRENDGKPKNK